MELKERKCKNLYRNENWRNVYQEANRLKIIHFKEDGFAFIIILKL